MREVRKKDEGRGGMLRGRIALQEETTAVTVNIVSAKNALGIAIYTVFCWFSVYLYTRTCI